MSKNHDQKIKEDLKDLLTNNETLDYVLYGQLAPQIGRILLIIGMWIVVALLIIFKVLPFALYLIIIVLLLLLISYLFFYDTVYLGKFGKNLYLHKFNKLKINAKKEKIMIRNVDIIRERTSDFHLTIKVKINEKEQFVIFKRNCNISKYPNQSTNMQKLVVDIKKAHKK